MWKELILEKASLKLPNKQSEVIGLLQFWTTKSTHYFLNELKVTKNPKNFIIQPIVRESLAYFLKGAGGR